eukprot:TRINITY_DN3974_c0_g1_i2.p1 TRINITY_DN3974_c0_g1~~TRINITY_DN3974_c0_g1_i2.p1  ORF type:complete len:590 (-),score=125.46 TRINITY_DN3974_c0_g1_i2:188-1957(-)
MAADEQESKRFSAGDVAKLLSEHLEKRPSRSNLVESNIIKSFTADPKLQQVMLALIRVQRESELGSLLKRRRTLQELIDQNIILSGPEVSPYVQEARRKILRNSREHTLNKFLEKRPSIAEMAQQNLLTDTMTWTKLSPSGAIPTSRNCHTVTTASDKLYLIGGFGGSSGKLTELLVLDPDNLSWSRPLVAGQIPLERYSHSCSAVGGSLYLFGGCSISVDGLYFNDIFVLNTEQKQLLLPWAGIPHVAHIERQDMLMWYSVSASGDIPSPRAAHSMTVIGERLYLFGGNDGINLFNDLYCFETSSCVWSRLNTFGDVPAPRAGHTATLVVESSVFVFGGGTASGPSNELFILNVESLVWSRAHFSGTPPRPRISHSAELILKNQLLIFGGGTVTRVFDDLHVLDVTQGCWSRPRDSGIVPVPRAGHAFNAVGSKIYVFGGANCEGEMFNDLHVLDTAFFKLKNVLEEKSSPSPNRRKAVLAPEMDPLPSNATAEDNNLFQSDLTKESSAIERNAEFLLGQIDHTADRLQGLLISVKRDVEKKHNQFKSRSKQVLALLHVSCCDLVGALSWFRQWKRRVTINSLLCRIS